MSLDVRFIGDTAVVANLKGMSDQIVKAGTNSIKRSTMKVLAKAKQKVSGEVLKNRTGTLRRAINQRVVVGYWQVVGTVGIKLRYAAAHEFGCHDVVNVPEYIRRTHGQVKAYKAESRLRKRLAKQGFDVAPAKSEAGTVIVRAHTMRMNLPERSFLRSSLKDLQSDIIADLRASVAKAVKE